MPTRAHARAVARCRPSTPAAPDVDVLARHLEFRAHDPADRPPRRAAPEDYRAVVPRADVDVDAAVEVVRPISEAVRTRGAEAIARALRCGSTGSAPSTCGSRRRRWPTRWPRSTRRSEPVSRSRSARLRRTCEAELEPEVVTDLARRRCDGHPPVRAGPPGRAVRAGRPGPAGLQRRDERRAGPGRGRRVHRPGELAAEGPRRSARADDPGGLCAARRRRGVRRRRGAGDRDVRLRRGGVRSRSTWSPAPATSTRSRPSGCSRAWWGSTPRPGRPRSRSWPTTAPTRRTSPPTWSARPSTTRRPPACW